jgi:hypothetical protein
MCTRRQVTACVRVPAGRERREEVVQFQTTVRGLLTLRDWLQAHRVTQVAMEATGVYWKPVGGARGRLRAAAGQRPPRQAGPRPQDRRLRRGLALPAHRGRPPAGELRAAEADPALRQLTRYRKAQVKERQREAQRLHKALEDTGIKLDCVASDILGVSGRAMLDALCRGTTDPAVLADLARGRLRKKIPALKEALEGRFDSLHALLVLIDPRPPRLPRRADRAALGGDRGAAAPFRGRP